MFAFWPEGECELFYWTALVLEEWIFPPASSPFIVWLGGCFPVFFVKWGEPCIWVPCGCSPSIPWDLSHGQSTPSVTWKLWKLITVLTAPAQSWCQVPPFPVALCLGGDLFGLCRQSSSQRKQSCFWVRLSGDWLQMKQCPAFWIIAALKVILPGFSWNFLLCTELRNFPRRFTNVSNCWIQWHSWFRHSCTFQASPGICCALRSRVPIWTHPFQLLIGPQVTEGNKTVKILAASLVVCCAKMWLALCYLCAAAPPENGFPAPPVLIATAPVWIVEN